MTHYISVAQERGTKCEFAKKHELSLVMTILCTPSETRERKEDNYLMFPAYNSHEDEYQRLERCVDKFSVIVIDCDNKEKNPNIIDDWKDAMKNYNYLIYETATSTLTQPKFRAIVPIDRELDWNADMKNAIFQTFSRFADPKATWFFSPNTSKLNSVYDHDVGREFPASVISRKAEQIRVSRETQTSIHELKSLLYDINSPDGWRHLPSVKHCLEGLTKGERDTSLNAACYAMDKNGYRNHIHEFLNECVVDSAIRRKFMLKYK